MCQAEPNGNLYKLDANSIVIHILLLSNEAMSTKWTSQEKDLPSFLLAYF